MHWAIEKMTKTLFFANDKYLLRDCFFLLLKFLRFADYRNLNDDDPLKISPFINRLKEIIQTMCTCQIKILLWMKSCCFFKERLYFRAYSPSKCSHYGINISALINKFGYTFSLNISIFSILPVNQKFLKKCIFFHFKTLEPQK